jgi:hypothetical protein
MKMMKIMMMRIGFRLCMLADGEGFYHSTRQQHYLAAVVVDVWGYIAGGGCFMLLLSLLLLFQAS